VTQSSVISPSELEEVLQTPLSPALRDDCLAADLRYEELSNAERDAYILEVLRTLTGDGLVVSGEHRLQEWESGWAQELESLERGVDPSAFIPGYYGKHRLLHWRQRIVRPLVANFDYRIHRILIDWVIETFLGSVEALYEFGCGPAYHLIRARRHLPTARLVGLDWTRTSQRIIARILASGRERNIEGRNFNFYEPDMSLDVPRNSGVLTVAALEQVGERFEPFLKFLLEKKPAICVNMEPIDELMDPNNLIDQLSVLYCRKRHYLDGFLTRLRELERERKVNIHLERRTYTGSFFIEGHSVVVWSPL
jgi:hypothetical protein